MSQFIVGLDEFRQPVAIKLFDKQELHSQSSSAHAQHQLNQIEKEINVLRKLRHPNIVQLYVPYQHYI